jgi:hypothetical protein
MYGLGSFYESGTKSLNCCDAGVVTYTAVGYQQSDEECGNWRFSVTFSETDPNNCISSIEGIRWFNPLTNHEVEGQNVNYYISGSGANIQLKFMICGTCGTQEFIIDVYANNDPDCSSNLCHSKIDYCQTFPCSDTDFTFHEHDLEIIKMVDSNGDCFYLSANDNPYGIFHFPYNLFHQPYFPPLNMPNIYDLINDLNTFLSPQYGHYGHAFICKYNQPSICKIKFEIVGSDLSFTKWIARGYYWQDCKRFQTCGIKRPLAEGNNCSNPYYCEGQLPLVYSNGDFNSDNFDSGFDQSQKMDFVVEPNLSDDIISIKILSDVKNEKEIQILNITDQVLQYLNFIENDQEINISDYISGIYLVRIRDKSTGISIIRKFVKI